MQNLVLKSVNFIFKHKWCDVDFYFYHCDWLSQILLRINKKNDDQLDQSISTAVGKPSIQVILNFLTLSLLNK